MTKLAFNKQVFFGGLLGCVLGMNAVYVSADNAQNPDGCHAQTEGWQSMTSSQIGLNVDGELRMLTVRLADDNRERAAGYQWLCETDAAASAILFEFPEDVHTAFHMRNVFVPLVIAFFDAAGKKVETLYMGAEPPGYDQPAQYYRPATAYRYALEIPEGNPASAWLYAHDLQFE